MKVNLYVNFYVDKNPIRQKELEECLKKNIQNKYIDKITVILSASHIQYFNDFNSKISVDGAKSKTEIKLVTYESRPTYNDYFLITRNDSAQDDLNIISNTDIFFDETLKKVKDFHWKNKYCLALSRWDTIDFTEKGARLFNRADSQDVWIIKGSIPHIQDADFTLGVAGCDNKIAWLLNNSGYEVINPSKEIKTYHLHLSDIRNYIVNNYIERIPPPYLQVHPSMLP